MAWLRGLFARQPNGECQRVLHLRVTRFAQMLRNYGALLDLIADAAEKQAGEFILDRQYVISLAERVLDLADTVLFDAAVLAPRHETAFFAALEHMRAELRGLLSAPVPPLQGELQPQPPVPTSFVGARAVGPEALAEGLAQARVALRGQGQVACRGLAAGPVFNLACERDPRALPAGAVLVGRDLDLDGEVIPVIRRAGAILLDSGTAGGSVASLARELRIPTLVGLGNASATLLGETIVTVDADENVVYYGRVQPLFDYYAAERLGTEEEEEYALLRAVRQTAFPLTLAGDPPPSATPAECRSLHDLVHLAHSFAGEALFEVMTRSAGAVQPTEVPFTRGVSGRLIDLGGGLTPGGGETALADLPRLFFDGLDCVGCRQRPAGDGHRHTRAAVAVVDEERLLAALATAGGFDLVDAVATEGRADNRLYCRFAPRSGASDGTGGRGAVAGGVLDRLGFAVARTQREVSGWIARLPRVEIEERLQIAGRLCGFLDELGEAPPRPEMLANAVDRFLRERA